MSNKQKSFLTLLFKRMDYMHGKIYKIISDKGDKVYIGSTTRINLLYRLGNHKSQYKRWKDGKSKSKMSSFELFEEYGVENCSIVLLEKFSCSSKTELEFKEAEYINSMECVNKLMKK
jgi:hypothetical protein